MTTTPPPPPPVPVVDPSAGSSQTVPAAPGHDPVAEEMTRIRRRLVPHLLDLIRTEHIIKRSRRFPEHFPGATRPPGPLLGLSDPETLERERGAVEDDRKRLAWALAGFLAETVAAGGFEITRHPSPAPA